MYKLIGTGDITKILHTTLTNRGIQDIEKYLNPSVEHEIHYSKLNKIDKAVELFIKNKEGNIVIISDRDLDGQTSSAIMHKYILDYTEAKVINIQHPKRENGLTKHMMSEINKLTIKPDLIILPDSSSNDKEQHELLNSQGIDIIVLDHHEIHNEITENENTVVVNPILSPEYENKQLSGVGVTYKFLQALDDKLGKSGADDNLDLVALGNIGDSMDMRSPDTRSIVMRGLENIKNKFVKQLIFENTSKGDKVSPHLLSWKVFPKVNALIRVGTVEQLQFVYEGMLGKEGEYENKRARSEKKRWETHEQKAVRLCTNAYGRQRTQREKIKKEVIAYVEDKNLDKFPIIVATMPSDFDTGGLTGYVAGSLTNYYERPVLLTTYNEEKQAYEGSLRGIDSILPTTKSFLEASGKLQGFGHENACGVYIHEEDLDGLMEYIDKNMKLEPLVEVDFILPYEQVTQELIEEVASYEEYWGKNVEPPMFAITDVELPMEDFNVGNAISKVKDKGIELATFSLPNSIAQYAQDEKIVKADVVGTLSINRWFNFRKRELEEIRQIMIEEFAVKEVEEVEDTFGFLW